MNWKAFGTVGLTVAKVMVPQIATAEAAFTAIKSGPDKKAAVMASMKSSIELAEALSGREIADQDLLAQGMSEMNDAIVKIMNALKVEGSSEGDLRAAMK